MIPRRSFLGLGTVAATTALASKATGDLKRQGPSILCCIHPRRRDPQAFWDLAWTRDTLSHVEWLRSQGHQVTRFHISANDLPWIEVRVFGTTERLTKLIEGLMQPGSELETMLDCIGVISVDWDSGVL